MGSCISSHSALGLSKKIPIMSSSSSLKIRKETLKKRKTKGNGAKGNDGLLDRQLGISDEEKLQQVKGRMFLNGASEVACLHTQQGKKGTNQDAMLVWENFASRTDSIFCGVFDGHGPFGHMVAKKVRDSLPLKLCSQWRGSIGGDNSPLQHGDMDSEESSSTSIDDEWTKSVDDLSEKLPEMHMTLRKSFLKAFKLMDKELKLHPSINCLCSGSTAVTVLKQGQELVIGNVGDSRAILGTRDNDNNLVAVQLTVDLKPNLPREAERIHQCNGRVFALQDEPEVARVWLPNNDSPGLAMARAFGDFCLKDYGLISVPDISYHRLTKKDEFIVLATDGVWDALSNKEVVDIVTSAPTRGTAARALVDCAVRSWRLKFPTSKIDDCAAVCLFLDIDSKESVKQQMNEIVREGTDESVINETRASPSGQSCALDTSETAPVLEEPKQDKLPERTKSTRSLADCISTSEEGEWSALEGITRVNSLLNLPRFSSGDKRSARKKWL